MWCDLSRAGSSCVVLTNSSEWRNPLDYGSDLTLTLGDDEGIFKFLRRSKFKVSIEYALSKTWTCFRNLWGHRSCLPFNCLVFGR